MSVRQIAKLAGVSAATVSMALRNNPRIPEATRQRVSAFARRLGYKPNAKIAELMGQVHLSRHPRLEACLGVISFYDQEQPWEGSLHLRRIYEGMRRRADALGYRLEPLWLRAPGMTPRRFCAILDTRRIDGLLCLGSPNFDEDFPSEFDHYAVVTQGLSIRTGLHRIVNHAYNDIWHALAKVYAMGYRRPGLALGHYEDIRSGHANLSAYLGWCEHTLGGAAPMPVLRLNRMEGKPLLAWLKRHRPDVVIVAHVPDVLAEFVDCLRRWKIRVPEDIGVAAVSQLLKGTNFSGFEENQLLMGAWAVELLAARIMNRDFGIPRFPRVEMIESQWIDAQSLRPSHTKRRK